MLKLSIDKIKIAFIFALVVLNGGYALSLGHQTLILVISFLFVLLDVLTSKTKLKLRFNSLIFLLLILMQFFLTFIANFDIGGIGEYIRLTGVFLFCYYVYISYSSKDIVYGFSDFMYFIAIVSLVFFVWILLFPTAAFRVRNGYGSEYMTCFLSFVNVSSFGRNCGIFWEPSVFSAVCFIWGIIEICVIRQLKQRKLRIIVLLLTIISTNSTSGYVYLLFLIAAFLFRNDSKKYGFYRIALSIILMATGIFVYYNYEMILLKLVDMNPIVFKKLMMNNASVTDRTIGPLADLYVSLRNLFGIGLTQLTPTVEKVAHEVYGTVIHTRTSTITYYCAAFGLMSGITIIAALIGFIKRNTKSFLLMMIVIFGVGFMSVSTPLHDSAIFIILLFIGVQENNIERNIKSF